MIPTESSSAVAIADSGFSDTNLRDDDAWILVTGRKKQNLSVILPDKSKIISTTAGTINVQGIPVHANIFDNLDLHHSLISMHDFTNAGCTVALQHNNITITNADNAVILTHPKESTAKLWTIPIEKLQTPVINNVVSNQIIAEEVAYYHAALGSPPVGSLIKAMRRGYLGNLPLRYNDLIKNQPNSKATAFGHLNQQRQNYRSTRPTLKPIVPPVDNENNANDDETENDEQIYHAFIHVEMK